MNLSFQNQSDFYEVMGTDAHVIGEPYIDESHAFAPVKLAQRICLPGKEEFNHYHIYRILHACLRRSSTSGNEKMYCIEQSEFWHHDKNTSVTRGRKQESNKSSSTPRSRALINLIYIEPILTIAVTEPAHAYSYSPNRALIRREIPLPNSSTLTYDASPCLHV